MKQEISLFLLFVSVPIISVLLTLAVMYPYILLAPIGYSLTGLILTLITFYIVVGGLLILFDNFGVY